MVVLLQMKAQAELRQSSCKLWLILITPFLNARSIEDQQQINSPAVKIMFLSLNDYSTQAPAFVYGEACQNSGVKTEWPT